MRIIVSPAKKMRDELDSLEPRQLPCLLPQTEQLLELLRAMPYAGLKKLLACNDAIARQNWQRYQEMDLRRRLSPALLAYDGIQYQYMAPNVFTREEFHYVEEHLRILSGFYGLLRPFDGVRPYRLEMQAKLQNPRGKDLYAFWGDQLSRVLAGQTDVIVDLASEEYSKAVSRHWAGQWISPVFAERENGRLREKGVYVKMARGEMVRFLAENQVEDPRQMREFCEMGYRFQPSLSTEHIYFFVRDRATRQKSDF
ncbi:MAG TPA: peroxide stress protein YaaA [Firmicutes bacterium]|nr:peroxide stress protein YaaA [Bacillota bacterium]